MKPEQRAAIAVIQAGEATMRPGLFVFTTPDGFAWVEPAYLEPAPSRESFHRVRGSLTLLPAGFELDGEDGRRYLVGSLDDLEDGVGADLRQVCDWADAEIRRAGGTMAGERERLRQLLAAELA
jgi:hypothetical protein